jgi:hypothetical protein
VPEGEEDEDPQVVFAFAIRGLDELDQGQNFASPCLKLFRGEEAEAIRRHLKKQCVDLLSYALICSFPPHVHDPTRAPD